MYSRYVGNAIAASGALFATVAMFMLATSAFARTTPKLTVISENNYPAGARQFVVHSALVGRDFDIVVSPPPIFGSWISADMKSAGAKQLKQKLPAIYALDGGYGIAGPMAQMMAGVGTMSPAYVVSVGYNDSQYQWRDTDLLYRPATEGGVTYGGHGAAFLAFLTEELRPFLDARFPLDPAKAILFGHSFGGLFAANVLAESPEAFDGYAIGSPSMWIDPEVLDKLSSAAEGDGRRVFIAVGQDEEPRMLDGVGRLYALLTAAPSSFKVERKVFAGEGHIRTTPCWSRLPSGGYCRPQGSNGRQSLRRLRICSALQALTSLPTAA
jgi:enterochelin esterase-like enzyme